MPVAFRGATEGVPKGGGKPGAADAGAHDAFLEMEGGLVVGDADGGNADLEEVEDGREGIVRGPMVEATEERGAGIEVANTGRSGARPGVEAAPRGGVGLEHGNRAAIVGEERRGGQAGHTGPYDHDVARGGGSRVVGKRA